MDLYYFNEAQIERMKPYFPLSHGVPRVDDRRVLSGASPQARYLLAHKGYDADWFREALYQKGTTPVHPAREKPQATYSL